MRLPAWLSLTIIATVSTSVSVQAQNTDDELRAFAAGVVKARPFVWPFSGYGVYLGQNAFITAAHVVGHWPLFSDPTIAIADREISAKVIKKGSFPELDLALLVAEDFVLPVNLGLRRNPLCKTIPTAGASVIVVSPERAERSQVISAAAIAPRNRGHFRSLINEPHVSGSAIFDPERKCLLGIMSAAVMKLDDFRTAPPRPQIGLRLDRSAGYFVPAPAITSFIPARLRF
jgi:hypothetical protein